MIQNKDPEKARHYLDLLDAARSNGHWQEIPELIRKIEKHSPQRHCLRLTAQTEQRIAAQATQRSLSPKSSTSSTLAQAGPPLQSLLEKENTFPEDRFQAQICLAWLYSVLHDQEQVLARLSTSDIVQAVDRFANVKSLTARWTHVCIVKGACLRATALESHGNITDAVQIYSSMLPYLAKTRSTIDNTFEANVWTERLVARYASLTSQHVKSHMNDTSGLLALKIIPAKSILGPFRIWSDYRAERQSGSFFTLTWVWKAYYDLQSILLQHQIVEPIFESRIQQRIELQKAQATYESILLRETTFPQANQTNAEIDSWVDQVMSNWRAMLEPPWQDEDLGQGGSAALSKVMLDVLYRSATRSFHSTKILRHLFTVHAQLGEFQLAFRALDTYLEIVKKGKARVEKSGETEPSLDDDATALYTAALGVKLLCEYGKRVDIERSLQIAELTQSWLDQIDRDAPSAARVNANDKGQDLVDHQTTSKHQAPGSAIAFAYHAIGISQARWARLTFETASRSDLLAKAISNLRHALCPEFGLQNSIEILHSLAYAFAEVRDVDSAITTVKEAITIGSDAEVQNTALSGEDGVAISARRSLLLKCWHLLALLLSARRNFATAIASCEAAFNPYGGKAVLYGDLTGLGSVTGLGVSESKALIELKVTQLALAEVVEGPEEAVNSSGELLGLYAKLSRYSEQDAITVPESTRVLHKSTTSSPQRSIRGSILGFPKDRRSKLAMNGNASSSVGSFEPPKQLIETPAIAVTSENRILPQNPNHHQHFLGRHESNRLKKRHSHRSLQGGSQRRNRAGSPLRPATSDGDQLARARVHAPTEGQSDSLSPLSAQTYGAGEVGVAISHDMPSSPPTPAVEKGNPANAITSSTQNMDRKNPNSLPIAPKPPSVPQVQTIALFNPLSLPEPRYSPLLQTRHALSALVQIWCQVSALYRRANLASDAQGAIREATTHVQSIEMAIATHDGSSMESFSSPGYGNLKSLGELWADVLSERGALHASLEEPAKASTAYETALSWCPNHAGAIVGLTTILLDSYERTCATTMGISNIAPKTSVGGIKSSITTEGVPTLASLPENFTRPAVTSETDAVDRASLRPDLTALSARDRAYKLLSSLTKSGRGWDDSSAWFALAKAYELSGQEDKAKEALWWVVELEEGKGIRNWSVASTY